KMPTQLDYSRPDCEAVRLPLSLRGKSLSRIWRGGSLIFAMTLSFSKTKLLDFLPIFVVQCGNGSGSWTKSSPELKEGERKISRGFSTAAMPFRAVLAFLLERIRTVALLVLAHTTEW